MWTAKLQTVIQGCIACSGPAAHALGCYEPGRHKPHDVAELGKLSRPVVGTGAGLPTDQARWQMGCEFEQLGTWDFWAHQGRFACFIDAMHSKDALGEINSNGYDCHDFPFQKK